MSKALRDGFEAGVRKAIEDGLITQEQVDADPEAFGRRAAALLAKELYADGIVHLVSLAQPRRPR